MTNLQVDIAVLFWFGGKNTAEIAVALGLPEYTVEGHIDVIKARARRPLGELAEAKAKMKMAGRT